MSEDANWSVENFDDLSACWLEADFLCFDLSIEFKAFGQYIVHVTEKDEIDGATCECSSIEEAKEVAVDMVRQILLDEYGALIYSVQHENKSNPKAH